MGVDLFLHGNLLFIGHSSFNGGNFQQYFCWVVDFIFQQVFCKSVESFSVQLWFAPFMIVSAFRELSHCPKFANEKCFSQWNRTSKQLVINGDSTDSGNIAIVGLYRAIYKWKAIPLRRPFEILVRFLLDVQPVCES